MARAPARRQQGKKGTQGSPDQKEEMGEGATLTRKLQVRGGCDEDLCAAHVDAPPIGILLIDNEQLVALAKRGFFRRSARVVVQSLGLGS